MIDRALGVLGGRARFLYAVAFAGAASRRPLPPRTRLLSLCFVPLLQDKAAAGVGCQPRQRYAGGLYSGASGSGSDEASPDVRRPVAAICFHFLFCLFFLFVVCSI